MVLLLMNCRGQEEAGCVACGCRPHTARLAIASRTMARKDVSVGDGDNNEDKDRDEDSNGNKDEVAAKMTTRQRQR